MALLSVFSLLIIFESSNLLSNAVYTYCTIPCPLMGPAQPPSSTGTIQLPSKRQTRWRASSPAYDDYTDYDDIPEEYPPASKSRSRPQPAKDPPQSKKSKPPPEVTEPTQKTRSSGQPSTPSIQPCRRFFTSLFSIPGAVVDTMIGGEITL